MPESSLNRYKNWPKHEILSKTCVPPEAPLFMRLDGRRFSAHSAYGNKVENQGKLDPATFHTQKWGRANPTNSGTDKTEEGEIDCQSRRDSRKSKN